MSYLSERSNTARILSIILFIGILPVWFFYLGMEYYKTMDIINKSKNLNNYAKVTLDTSNQ